MSAQDAVQTLKSYFETRQAARQAMMAIQEGVEIGIVIGGHVECALFRRGDKPVVEERAAVKPDVIFELRPETVYVLNGQTKDDIADIGLNIFKEILAGNIQIRVPGRWMNLISRGYLDMLKKGGAPVTAFLAKNGLASLGKIAAAVKNMRRS